MKRFTMLVLGLLSVALVGCTTSTPPNLAGLARIKNGENARSARVDHLNPGDTAELAILEGPGVVRHLWFTAMCDDPRAYGKMVLRVWWDGEDEPSIEVPMSDFFGVGFGEERLVRSAAVEMVPAGLPGHAALTCWLPMPFEKARFTVENQTGDTVMLFHILNWEKVDADLSQHGRLHAQWRRSNPVERGEGHMVLAAEGTGHYVGTVLSIRRLEEGSWVEGGEDFYIDLSGNELAALDAWDRELVDDPERRLPADGTNIANQPAGPVPPTLPGIGGEDYFCQSWGYRDFDQSLYHGTSLGPEDRDRLSAYRFHLLDPVRFDKNIRVHFRNHGWDVQSRADDMSSVAFWYQLEPHAPFPALPPAGERLPPKNTAAE